MATAPRRHQLKLPAANQRLVGDDGMMNPVWYAYFRGLERALITAGVVTIADYDPATLVTGQTLRWSATATPPRFIPGA